jgi:F-type H+-transporting ATPase subunit b
MCEMLATGLSERLRPTPFMDEILHQLGELVLGSVPTMVLFILLIAAYGVLVRRPLERVLAERRARTVGAVEQARGGLATAEAETAAYEEKLRRAKAEIFLAREQKLKQWNLEREAAIEQVRHAAQHRVQEARLSIEQSAAEARAQIEGLSEELSSRVLAAIMPGREVSAEVAQ